MIITRVEVSDIGHTSDLRKKQNWPALCPSFSPILTPISPMTSQVAKPAEGFQGIPKAVFIVRNKVLQGEKDWL